MIHLIDYVCMFISTPVFAYYMTFISAVYDADIPDVSLVGSL